MAESLYKHVSPKKKVEDDKKLDSSRLHILNVVYSNCKMGEKSLEILALMIPNLQQLVLNNFYHGQNMKLSRKLVDEILENGQ